MSESERRAHPRIRLARKVGVALSSGEVVYLWSQDLSMQGLQLLSKYNADLGDALNLFLNLPKPGSHRHVRVEMLVRIRHVTYSGQLNRFRIGCEITEFQGDGRRIYAAWIETQLLRFIGLYGAV